MAAPPRPRLGISACLLGQRVRYDGGHKRDPTCLEVMGPAVEWVPVCPEVEVGMPVPRPPIRLVGRSQAPRLLAVPDGEDWTVRMAAWADRRAGELARLDLDGYVTKRDSPSCGLAGVPVEPDGGGPVRWEGVGAFVAVLRAKLPRLPIVDEAQLRDAEARRRFLALVSAHAAGRGR